MSRPGPNIATNHGPSRGNRTHAQPVLELPHRCSERDVQRDELVHVDQGATARALGVLHSVQKLPDHALKSRPTNPTPSAGRCRCAILTPEAAMLDMRATAKGAQRDVEHEGSSGMRKSNIRNHGR
ncbi:unnamed protein product [Ectocarpus sp. 6 AP-2014]